MCIKWLPNTIDMANTTLQNNFKKYRWNHWTDQRGKLSTGIFTPEPQLRSSFFPGRPHQNERCEPPCFQNAGLEYNAHRLRTPVPSQEKLQTALPLAGRAAGSIAVASLRHPSWGQAAKGGARKTLPPRAPSSHVLFTYGHCAIAHRIANSIRSSIEDS